jgi:hypothetical protein
VQPDVVLSPPAAELPAAGREFADQAGTKHFRHPVAGLLDVAFDAMPLPAREDQHLTMTCNTAEPGSPSQDALKLPASWTATPSPGQATAAGEHAR